MGVIEEVVYLARPRKSRKVCQLPVTLEFAPLDSPSRKEPVFLTIDEYESIRILDKEGRSQEECGVYMKVARTTVQQIYTQARHKIAVALVEGRPLRIEGGDYELCEGKEEFCDCGGCLKHRKKV
ncbi:MAG: DUF134 domain-containing protein [Lachnospiraceae bacterium]